MKYEIGDRVKVVKTVKGSESFRKKMVGQKGVVDAVRESNEFPFIISFDVEGRWAFDEEELLGIDKQLTIE